LKKEIKRTKCENVMKGEKESERHREQIKGDIEKERKEGQ
jgi:hypothetical protein